MIALKPEWKELLPYLTAQELEEVERLLTWDSQQSIEPDWRTWLATNFPAVCTAPLAPRHERLYDWFEALKPGVKVRARIEVWPRFGAKSSTGELGVVRASLKPSRHFVLYVSGTQLQANNHVQSIATFLEKIGVERALNQYGQAKGWKVDLLRTKNDFNVLALGLDASVRGVKLDQFRPDLIILDDIDSSTDTLDAVDKKIQNITTAILPAGSADCAVLVLQNRIHKNSIVSQLCSDRAEFLLHRETAFEEPAVIGLEVKSVPQENGPNTWEIIGGEFTWQGQGKAECEDQINRYGIKAFRRECQHEVKDADGIFFRVSMLGTVRPEEVPALTSVCLSGDLAATEGGGDHTVLTLMGTDGTRYYVLMVLRGQWSSERVRQIINLARTYYKAQYRNLTVKLPQDPGQAGKDQAQQLRDKYPDASIEIVSGAKWTRATNLAEAVNLGNVSLVVQDVPEVFAPYIQDRQSWRWHTALIDEFSDFKEGIKDQLDDTVDSASDGFDHIATVNHITILKW